MFNKLEEVKYFKEIESLKSLQVKAEAYLEPKRASMMKLFVKIVNKLLFLLKKLDHRCSILKKPLKIMKFSRRSLCGANHRDCYNV